MWTCLYLSHIVVIIMIIIAILGIIYGISQKKIKVYQVIVIFLFCVISMALVTGVTSMQCIDDLNSEIDYVTETSKTDYWTYDSTEMSMVDSYTDDYLITLDSKEFIKATDDIYYVTYNYTYTNSEDATEEKGKVYYIVNSDNQMKTIVMTSINNEDKEVEFEERVLEIINTMDL